MRGIDGALSVIAQAERGAFLSEALRDVWGDIESDGERKLAASLSYLVFRKLNLWRHLFAKYCKRSSDSISQKTQRLVVVGIAGLLELERFSPASLVSALVQRVEDEAEKPFANGILRTVGREAAAYVDSLRGSTSLRDIALGYGVPGWAAAQWHSELGMQEAKRLVIASSSRSFMSLRLTPGADLDRWIETCGSKIDGLPPREELRGAFSSSVRLRSNPLPTELPGYKDGSITPMNESSMWAVETFAQFLKPGLRLLDMCCGRGVKAAQIAKLAEGCEIECWDLSVSRVAAAQKEFARLGVDRPADFRAGDARSLEPKKRPDAILLDAPCSGSGTWRRHPEAKWRSSPERVESQAALQSELFYRAADIVATGGVIVYCTCSSFRAENEMSVGSVMSRRRDLAEIPIRREPGIAAQKGRPYGMTVYPDNEWADGFYAAVFKKMGGDRR